MNSIRTLFFALLFFCQNIGAQVDTVPPVLVCKNLPWIQLSDVCYGNVNVQELVDTGKAFTLGKDSDEYKNLSVQLGNEQKSLAKMTAQYAALGGLIVTNKAQSAFKKLGDVAKSAFSKISKFARHDLLFISNQEKLLPDFHKVLF